MIHQGEATVHWKSKKGESNQHRKGVDLGSMQLVENPRTFYHLQQKGLSQVASQAVHYSSRVNPIADNH